MSLGPAALADSMLQGQCAQRYNHDRDAGCDLWHSWVTFDV